MSTTDSAGSGPADTKGFLDYPNVDSPSCQLLGPTALVVQALMGVLVILSLVYKRHREKPMRPWRIWVFDVSKQVFGQMFVHGLNVLISGVISDVTSGNACVSYFLNILIDTTLGVGIIYGVLHALNWLFTEKLGLKGFESGVYGNPPSVNYWCRQAATYVVALTTMKFVVIVLLVTFPGIFKIGEWLLSWTWTGKGDHVQVIFVMGVFPIVMNILQFWLIDSIVKAASGPVALEPDIENPIGPDHEPLFNAGSDDEDDDYHTRRRDIEDQSSTHPSQSSIESSSNSQTKSYATGTTTPEMEPKLIYPSAQDQVQDHHAYPPSLSSSQTSQSTSSPNPKSLTKSHSNRAKRLAHPAPRSFSPSSSSLGRPRTPDNSTVKTNPTILTSEDASRHTDEWAVSWDDEIEGGWGDEHIVDSKVNGRATDTVVSQPPRSRRLS